MWAHRHWIGRFLSPGRHGRELADYSTWCNAVEGNTTFYAVPSPTTVASWAEQAPSSFRFAFKLPRTITHARRLHHATNELRHFLHVVEPLGERIGPLQIQLPPSFGPESFDALRTFVERLPGSHEWVVELRHPAFFEGQRAQHVLDDLLRAHGVGRVVLDTRPLYDTPVRTEAAVDERRTKPKLPIALEHVGSTPVVRLIGGDELEGTVAGLRRWVPAVVDWLIAGRSPYLFVHQPENTDSPALARRFHEEVRAVLPDLAPLPEPAPIAPAGEVPGQTSLW